MSKHIRIISIILILALLLCACFNTKPTLEATTPTPIIIVVKATSPPDTPQPTEEPTTLELSPTEEPTLLPTDTPIPLATITPTPEATITPTPQPTFALPTMSLVTGCLIVTPVPTAQFTQAELIETFELDDGALDNASPSLILEVSDYKILGDDSEASEITGYIKAATEAKIIVDEIELVVDRSRPSQYRVINDSYDNTIYPIDPNCEVWFLAGSYPHYRVPIADLPDYIDGWGGTVPWDIYIEDGKVVMLVERYVP